MKKAIVSLCLVWISLASCKVSAETIKWVITEEPPITYAKDEGHAGYGFEILQRIQQRLSQYDHETVVAGNYKRLTLEVREGPLTCALGLFKTEERLKTMSFANVPVFYFFNIQIVLRRELFETLQQPEMLSLRNMLADTEYRLGISKGRTYSEELSRVLDECKESDNIWIGAQGNVAESLLKMLTMKRIDYMFLYPEEAVYLSRKLGVEDEIVTVPIQEAHDLGYSWPVCTDNEAGRAVTANISDILQEIRREDSYRELYEAWISENLVNTYREHYREHFLNIYEE